MIPLIIEALQRVEHPRFFENERGFQGQFQANLQIAGAAPPNAIVEEEHQKTRTRHRIRRRPDIIIHIPTPDGGNRRAGNFAVFNLKRAAGPAAAVKDFVALDALIEALDYELAAFVNIAGERTHADRYHGRFRDRIHFFSVWRDGNDTRVRHAHYDNGRLVER